MNCEMQTKKISTNQTSQCYKGNVDCRVKVAVETICGVDEMNITKEDAETILAYHRGEQIQFSSDITDGWRGVVGVPTWNFTGNKYRVKPDPKSLWVNEYEYDVGVHKEKHKAIESAAGDSAIRIAVHYREVIEG